MYLDSYHVTLTNMSPQNILVNKRSQPKVKIHDLSQATCGPSTLNEHQPHQLHRNNENLEPAVTAEGCEQLWHEGDRRMSSEVIQSGQAHGSLSDLYSVCMIVYLMCMKDIRVSPMTPSSAAMGLNIQQDFDSVRCTYAMRDLIAQCTQSKASLRPSLKEIHSWIQHVN